MSDEVETEKTPNDKVITITHLRNRMGFKPLNFEWGKVEWDEDEIQD